MNQFRAHDLAMHCANFSMAEAQFRRYADQDRPALDTAIETFAKELESAALNLKDAGMASASEELGRILRSVRREKQHPSALEVEARSVGHRILKELKDRKFLRIATDRRSYLDSDNLFGPKVAAAFESAKDDIKASGNCLAAECSTAAVFHAMRAAEAGLRALAYDRRVKVFKNKKTMFELPLELASWDQIISELEAAESEIQGYPQTLAREEQLAFYHGALMQFRAFKNVFRNVVMHARESYDRDQARSAVEKVREFMQTLASRIKEGDQTPVIWT